MHDYLLSVILGIIEGLTEFLPVSSTAHLRISEALLHISLTDGYWKMYSIVIQLGAILCLPVYFRGRIAKFVSTFPRGESGDRTALTHPLGLTMIAFVITAIPAFFLSKMIGKHLESLSIMGTSLLVGGVVMWIVDAMNARAEAAGPGVSVKPHSYLEDGNYEPGASGLDRRLPDSLGGVSRDVTVYGDHCIWTGGGNVTGVGVGVFFLFVHSDDGGGNRV